MQRIRSILVVVLVSLTVFLASCDSPKAKGPLYSPEQLAQIQDYVADVQSVRDRLIELPPLIQQQEWIDVISFIHGPLGELRVRTGRLARSLKPEATQKAALVASQDLFNDLNRIDEAAQLRDTTKALRNYNAVIADFDALLKYAPTDAS